MKKSEDSLRRRVAELVADAKRRRAESARDFAANAADAMRRRAEFGPWATELLRSVILPRLRLVESLVPDSRCPDTIEGAGLTLTFNVSRRIPATVTLHIILDLDDDGKVHVRCLPSILPILMEIRPQDELALPLQSLTDASIADFVETGLVRFVDDWLRLQRDPAYRRDNQVPDPVCGMRVDRWNPVGSEEHDGTRWFFCSRACRDRFVADPASFRSPKGSSA